jgi:hypothetical protein
MVSLVLTIIAFAGAMGVPAFLTAIVENAFKIRPSSSRTKASRRMNWTDRCRPVAMLLPPNGTLRAWGTTTGSSGAPARIACQRARKIGVTRSSSAHSTSSLLAARSSSVVTVAAMRNLAGRRFSATSRYHDSAPRIAGILPNSQLGQVAHELASCLYSPARPLPKSAAFYELRNASATKNCYCDSKVRSESSRLNGDACDVAGSPPMATHC